MERPPVVETIVEGFRDVHAKLRDAVRGLDAAALNWVPAAEANPIAVLVVHTIGSEQQVLRTVRSISGDRDRDAEFRATAESADDLIAQLDAADTFLDEVGSSITSEDLIAVRPRGDMPPQSGLNWLVTNYGHAREHLAHIDLTKQFYAATQDNGSRSESSS